MPIDQHDGPFDAPFEDRLGDALRTAGGAFETDRHALVSGGAVRGRRLLFRRRAALVGGVAGVALVGIGGALVLPGGDSGRDKDSVATSPSLPPPPDDDGTYSGADLVRELKKRLPKGEFSEEIGRGTSSENAPYAHVVYDDGKGAAAVDVGIALVEPDSETAFVATLCPDTNQMEYDSCRTSKLSDGSTLMLFQGYEYHRRGGTKNWYASLVSPKGYVVTVTEWNSPAQKGEPVSRDEPPLSTAQLKSIATAEIWRRAADAIPDEEDRSKEPQPGGSSTASVDAPTVDGDAIRETLLGLLPDGVDVVAKGGQESDYAYVVLDDGKGRSLVQINVQLGMGDVLGSVYGDDAETLPDGTVVDSRQEPGEKGGAGVVMWTVDTLRPGSGLRVVVSAFNSGSQTAAATRDTPALTMAQLKKIATSEKWAKLG
ncbi:hypothetical protein SGFS_045990 [Streptomyces graminofaciens]|uniref:LigA protein n=1 Tax=Streptomyces graminofaciens TaxID=68212 RepID=A0ABM9SBV6_9ACTN|nr:hypothetical protein [Streptomyces graminofaciens]BBC33305.1 hypothetical protein SGFS_045990 [Streptomyces graminofaciens]